MRRLLLAMAIVVPAWLLVPLVASAANTSAQVVNCAAASPWCFSPTPIQITVGSTVTWTNTTAPTHTATSDTGAWSTGNIASGATSASISFPTAGTFTYHCAIHPSMTGSVIVSAVAAAGPPVRALAPGGGAAAATLKGRVYLPALPAGALMLLLGLGLLAAGRVRRDRTQRVGERIDELPHQ
ncbi:MAG TPA: plastocyanin/azurin family copper-binding protein [Candidatus Dormibacteraeota bacterium]